MSSKILASAGAFLVNRFLTLHLHRVSNSNLNICSLGSHFSPKLMPTLSKLQNSPRLPKLAAEEFPYPYGLPSLRFFLPDGNVSAELVLLLPKRTYQPSHVKRKRTHGYFARKETKGGQKVVARRIAKGRSRITA